MKVALTIYVNQSILQLYQTYKNIQEKVYNLAPFIIYADVESTLVPEDNRKENPEESYMKKY